MRAVSLKETNELKYTKTTDRAERDCIDRFSGFVPMSDTFHINKSILFIKISIRAA